MMFGTRLTSDMVRRYRRAGSWGDETFYAILRDDVATYKLPEMIEAFDELPFTPTGKIQRHVLVRQVLERRAGQGAGR